MAASPSSVPYCNSRDLVAEKNFDATDAYCDNKVLFDSYRGIDFRKESGAAFACLAEEQHRRRSCRCLARHRRVSDTVERSSDICEMLMRMAVEGDVLKSTLADRTGLRCGKQRMIAQRSRTAALDRHAHHLMTLGVALGQTSQPVVLVAFGKGGLSNAKGHDPVPKKPLVRKMAHRTGTLGSGAQTRLVVVDEYKTSKSCPCGTCLRGRMKDVGTKGSRRLRKCSNEDCIFGKLPVDRDEAAAGTWASEME